MKALKYNHIQPGTKVRAYDFEKMKGRRNRFVEGTVKDHVSNHGVSFLRIKVCYDSMIDDLGDPCLDGRCGEMIYVPMETSCDSDWSHDRVQVVA